MGVLKTLIMFDRIMADNQRERQSTRTEGKTAEGN